MTCPDTDRALRAVGLRSTVRVTDNLDDVLADPRVEAVAVATPAWTHFEVALASLEEGKHVLVDKPFASSVAEGEKLVAAAHRSGLMLMCGHTYCYTPTVRKLQEALRDGALGDIQYLDSVRINLGLVEPDVDIFWDLGAYDSSIRDFILPDGCTAQAVGAQGADPIGVGHACVGYLTLPLVQRRHGPHSRQLAQSHQDQDGRHRRLQAHRRLGRHQPGAAAQHVR